ASVVSQGILIGLGYQDEFSWKQVAADAVSAAFTAGASAALGAAGQTAAKVGSTAKYAKVSVAALRVASAASKQLILNGKITSWTSLAAAGIGGALDVAKVQASSDFIDAGGAAALASGSQEALNAAEALQTLSTYQTALQYATPWVQLAETSIRNDGDLQPSDWVAAVGGTLSTALTSGLGVNEIANPIQRHLAKQGLNAAIGGAMSLYDKDAALNWMQNEVAQDFGSFLADYALYSDRQTQRQASEQALTASQRKAENERNDGLDWTTDPNQRIANVNDLDPRLQASLTGDNLAMQLGGRLDALPDNYEAIIAANGGSLPAEWVGEAGAVSYPVDYLPQVDGTDPLAGEINLDYALSQIDFGEQFYNPQVGQNPKEDLSNPGTYLRVIGDITLDAVSEGFSDAISAFGKGFVTFAKDLQAGERTGAELKSLLDFYDSRTESAAQFKTELSNSPFTQMLGEGVYRLDEALDLSEETKAYLGAAAVGLPLAGKVGKVGQFVPDKALVSPAEVNWNTSRALGLEIGDPRDYVVGNQIFESLRQAGVSPDRALRMSRDMLESGVDLPSTVSLQKGERLFKLVPTGSPPSGTTPYFVTGDVLERLPNSPQAIGEMLGLPQVPDSFELYSITAKSDIDVFQSQIAKFSVNNGEYLRNGGEIQTLVTRRDLFTEAQSLNRFITGQ
ncbi:hypothetical protein KQ940_22515, partial [Marinobacterium sp. D7]|uniref:hypothetical protein n=1 Tax=Marinobacterium ramblicola TaxID=2849041 RepID=UPI001C2D998A